MSEQQSLLIETAERLFADVAQARDVGFDALWRKLAEVELEGLLVPEAKGGFGGDWEDAFAVMRLAGVHALPAPIGEAIVGALLCAEAGLSSLSGLTTLAPRVTGRIDAKGRFSGTLAAAPWGRHAAAVLADVEGAVVRFRLADAIGVEERANPAGEPRDVFIFEMAPVERLPGRHSVLALGALLRTAQIAGALDAALAMSIAYANERQQFGKPIGNFQAVQQSLAVFAEEAAAVNCGGQAAARAASRGDARFEIAAAKLRANIASGIGAATAHQVHGAIGFTREHGLHHLTRRLVSWRSEFGGDRFWAEELGSAVCARGADEFWPFLTQLSDPKGE